MNCLNNASDSVIPQILRCIASIVLIGQEEQINFSNNEIWPTLEFIFQNVLFFSSKFNVQYQDSIEIVSSASSLLAALVTPLAGRHADISQVSTISNTLSEVSSYYTDLYALSDDRSELRPILSNLLRVLYAISVEDSTIPYYYSTYLTVFFSFSFIHSSARVRFFLSLPHLLHLPPPLPHRPQNRRQSRPSLRRHLRRLSFARSPRRPP